MKKLITDSNLWFFSAIVFSFTWAISDNGAMWMIIACASFIFGIEANNKEIK